MKDKSMIPTSWFLLSAGIGLVGLLLGSWVDYPLDAFLYHPQSLWARILAAYGPLPCFWGLGTLGALLINRGLKTSGWKKAGWMWLGMLIEAGCLVYMIYSAVHELEMPFFWALLIGAVVLLPMDRFLARLLEKGSEEEQKKAILLILLVCCGQFLLVQGLKTFMSRPRFIALMADSSLPFVPWWHNSKAIAHSSALYQINSDYFKSFPSAHTAAATCLFLGCLLPGFCHGLKVSWMFEISLAFSILVALSRMVLGFHYLSDVSMGFLITFGLFWLGYWYLFEKKSHDLTTSR